MGAASTPLVILKLAATPATTVINALCITFLHDQLGSVAAKLSIARSLTTTELRQL
jgi:hypothetical protein